MSWLPGNGSELSGGRGESCCRTHSHQVLTPPRGSQIQGKGSGRVDLVKKGREREREGGREGEKRGEERDCDCGCKILLKSNGRVGGDKPEFHFAPYLQIALLLEILRNSLSESSMRVNSVVAAFCTRAARLFLDPGE